MDNSRSLVSKSLLKSTRDVFTDVSEMGLDELIGNLTKDSDFINQLPIIKWLFVGNDYRSSIQSAFFIKKYACFIGQIASDLTVDFDDSKLLAVFSDEKIKEKLIDNTVLYLDKYHNELKARLLGELFVQTFRHQRFAISEYNSLMYSIELIHPFEGVASLKQFYDYHIEMKNEQDDKKKRDIWDKRSKTGYQLLATTGLLNLPQGGTFMGNLGGASLNELGKRFYEFVVINCDEYA